MYHAVRCSLYHEAGLPSVVRFDKPVLSMCLTVTWYCQDARLAGAVGVAAEDGHPAVRVGLHDPPQLVARRLRADGHRQLHQHVEKAKGVVQSAAPDKIGLPS